MSGYLPHDLTSRRVLLETLRPHPDNPRAGDTDAIAESLRVNGLFRPLVIATNGTILAGNHTYAAALSLGWAEIDVVTLDVEPHSAEAKRIILADNRTSDLATYDEGLLAIMLTSLQEEEGGLEGVGYSQEDLDKLLDSIEESLDLPEEDGPLSGSAAGTEIECPKCGHEFTLN